MLVDTPELYATALLDVVSCDTVSCDTETTGLSQVDRLFAIIICTGRDTYYFDKRALWDVDTLKKMFNHSCEWVFQNAKFDLRMLAHEGLSPVGTVRDLEVLARLVDNTHFRYSLADIGSRRGLPKSDEVKAYINKHKLYTDVESEYGRGETRLLHFDRVPIDIMQKYAENDARITYDLYKLEMQELDERSVPVLENESRLTKVCAKMEARGIMVDRDYTKRAMAHEQGLVDEAKQLFKDTYGKEYSESKGLLVPIFLAEGMEVPKTDKGNYSLTDEVLEEFTSPAARIIQKVRHYEKRISTYYSAFLEASARDGRIHPDMRQAGTTTGRFSYREPNLQNVPKEDDAEDADKAYVVRGCLVPSPGNIFVSLDYSQQEYRLMLSYANEQGLIGLVMAGADLHQATADMVGITRRQAKTLNFAILYGAGPDKIGAMLGISKYEASLLRDRYYSKLPRVEAFISQAIRTGRSRGHLYNWFGRKLRSSGRDFAYKLPNHLIQGGGADTCKKAMADIDALLTSGDYPMILQVHDDLTFDMHPSQLEVVDKIKGVMDNVFPMKNGMTLTVNVEASTKSLAARDMVTWQEYLSS